MRHISPLVVIGVLFIVMTIMALINPDRFEEMLDEFDAFTESISIEDDEPKPVTAPTTVKAPRSFEMFFTQGGKELTPKYYDVFHVAPAPFELVFRFTGVSQGVRLHLSFSDEYYDALKGEEQWPYSFVNDELAFIKPKIMRERLIVHGELGEIPDIYDEPQEVHVLKKGDFDSCKRLDNVMTCRKNVRTLLSKNSRGKISSDLTFIDFAWSSVYISATSILMGPRIPSKVNVEAWKEMDIDGKRYDKAFNCAVIKFR